MITSYRRVLALPGALTFSLTGLLARLPISMVSLGIVLLVSTRTGSYSLAGAVAAAYLVGNALFAVVQGRLADRLGQSRVLPWTILVFTGALLAMMAAVELGWPTPVPHVFAAVAGSALPQIGSCVRARWSHIVPDKQQLQTAFAVEAVIDEAVFLVGPILVTVLATAVHPLAGLLTAVGSGLVGTLALAAQRSTEPPAHPAGRHGPRIPMGWPVLGPLVVSGVTLGVVFGGVEVATVAFADEMGAKTVSGPLLAAVALGSLLSGLFSGAVAWRSSNAARFRVGMLLLAVSLVPLPFVEDFWVLAVILFVAGLTISPTLIASVAWIEETVPPRRLTEGISIMTTGMYVGLAPGAAGVGTVVDRYGASASYWVPVAAAAVGVVVAAATVLLVRRGPAAVVPSPSGSRG
jgi:MFS family permease